MPDQDPDWLGELNWQGYPRMEGRRDASAIPEDAPEARRREKIASAGESRLAAVGRENEVLRERLADMIKLAADFERRLSEAGTAYEGAILEAESRLRDAALERERLSGELEASKSEAGRLTARDAAREADLRLERERRADSEKALSDARRRLSELTAQAEHWNASAAEQAGALTELRRQASAQNQRIVQSKALTDQDVQLLRQELREFLAKFHRIQETLGENP
jgi:chromosome segregation ATPase